VHAIDFKTNNIATYVHKYKEKKNDKVKLKTQPKFKIKLQTKEKKKESQLPLPDSVFPKRSPLCLHCSLLVSQSPISPLLSKSPFFSLKKNPNPRESSICTLSEKKSLDSLCHFYFS